MDQEWSLSDTLRAAGGLAILAAGRFLIVRWKMAYRREFDAHWAIIRELQKINTVLYQELQEQKRQNELLREEPRDFH